MSNYYAGMTKPIQISTLSAVTAVTESVGSSQSKDIFKKFAAIVLETNTVNFEAGRILRAIVKGTHYRFQVQKKTINPTNEHQFRFNDLNKDINNNATIVVIVEEEKNRYAWASTVAEKNYDGKTFNFGSLLKSNEPNNGQF